MLSPLSLEHWLGSGDVNREKGTDRIEKLRDAPTPGDKEEEGVRDGYQAPGLYSWVGTFP